MIDFNAGVLGTLHECVEAELRYGLRRPFGSAETQSPDVDYNSVLAEHAFCLSVLADQAEEGGALQVAGFLRQDALHCHPMWWGTDATPTVVFQTRCRVTLCIGRLRASLACADPLSIARAIACELKLAPVVNLAWIHEHLARDTVEAWTS